MASDTEDYLMYMRNKPGQIVGRSLDPDKKTFNGFVPVVGLKNRKDFEYDKDGGWVYWIESENPQASSVSKIM